ncbi:MAG: hypothetical protein ACRDXB_03260, partial [Actinomycetes bacterium]
TGVPSELLSAMADAIMGNPTGVATLLATHVDDGTGHCRGCPLGAQRGYASGPCILRAAATLAAHRCDRAGRTPVLLTALTGSTRSPGAGSAMRL